MTSIQADDFSRQQLFIDSVVQGTVLCRTVFYSAACAVYFVVILVFTESMSSPQRGFAESAMVCFQEAIYWGPGLLLLMPLVVYDMLKVTNRFAGPIFRLRREMQRLAVGESERPLAFREGDYWTDLADHFDELRKELIELREYKANVEKARHATAKPTGLFAPDGVADANDFLSSL